MRNTKSTLVVAVVFVAAAFACSEQRAADQQGGAEVMAYALTAEDVASVTVTVTAPDISPPIVVNLTKVGDQWVANLSEIPAGTDRTFTLSAKDANGVEIYSGVATGVTITSGQTAAVAISGQETDPPPPVTNRAPVIDALVGSTTSVAQGGTVTLSVTAHDDDSGDIITFAWTATGGTLGTPAQASTSWTAPAADGVYRVTVQVQDTHLATAAMYLDLTVSASTSSQATIAVTLNKWPVVTSVTSTQGRINVNESTQLDVVATDADNDALTYAWAADSGCAGTFDSASLKSPTFTLGSTLPASGTCQLTVVVSDGRGGSNAGSITVTAAAPPPINLAPRITSAVQSVASAEAGQTVNLAVMAEDPEGAALTFAWAAPTGALGTPTTAAGSSQVVWTAPTPITADGSVTCTIADATGLTTVKTFTITGIDTTVPTLTALSFTPTSVDVTAAAATVTITATMTDNLSGFKLAGFFFADPSEIQLRECWISKPAGSSGLRSYGSTCTVTIPQYSEPGTWKLVEVYLADEVSNVVHLTMAQVQAMGFPVALTVVSDAGDVVAPTVAAFSVSPTPVNTSAGSVTVTATFTITDDKSGIWEAGVTFISPSGSQSRDCYIHPVGGTSALSYTASCTMVFPGDSETGEWTVDSLYALDNNFNERLMLPADLAAAGLPATLLVTSAP